MRRRSLLASMAVAPWLTPVQAAPAVRGEAVQWPSVKLLDGAAWSAEQARGRAVVVVFWSLHCGFCERHNEHIEKLHRAAAGKSLTVLGVAHERDAEAVRRHMARRAWSFPVSLERAPLAAALSERRGVPLTVSVDRQGRLREVIPGEMFEADVIGFLKLAEAG